MYRILFCLVVITGLSGCKRDVGRPQGVLSEPEMVNLLIELYLAEERLAKTSLPYDSVVTLVPLFRQKVFTDAGLQDSVFKVSMQYYMARPKRLEHIYTAVVDSLSLREQSQPNEYTQYAPPQ